MATETVSVPFVTRLSGRSFELIDSAELANRGAFLSLGSALTLESVLRRTSASHACASVAMCDSNMGRHSSRSGWRANVPNKPCHGTHFSL